MTQVPRDTFRDAPDDEPTAHDLPELAVPTYEAAPPTIESQPSPFHRVASLQRTAQGMPPPVTLEPKITVPTNVAVVAPVIIGGPMSDAQASPISGNWDAPTDPDLGGSPWIDAGPTEPTSAMPPRPKPIVPAPGSPTFEVSQSLEIEAMKHEIDVVTKRAAEPKRRARHPARRAGPGAALPTEVLPALSRRKKEEKEGSDWPLILGLLALALVIAGLVGVVAYGIVRSMNANAPPATHAAE